jgi:hypothetical protein
MGPYILKLGDFDVSTQCSDEVLTLCNHLLNTITLGQFAQWQGIFRSYIRWWSYLILRNKA